MTEGGAQVDMITMNRSIVLARSFDANGAFDLRVITAYSSDIIVLDGPTTLSDC